MADFEPPEYPAILTEKNWNKNKSLWMNFIEEQQTVAAAVENIVSVAQGFRDTVKAASKGK